MLPSISIWLLEKAQHRRLRREVRHVVGRAQAPPGAVPEEGADAAVVLLRALHLERQLRVASALRQHDAMAGLTRSIVEATLVGLYLVGGDGNRRRMAVDAHRGLKRVMHPWFPEEPNPGDMLGELVGLGHGPGMPTLRQVADHVDAGHDLGTYLDEQLGSYLYGHWYAPLSNLSVHTTGLSLGRHFPLRWSSSCQLRPWGILPRRGAIRTADGAIALLAAILAEEHGGESRWLRRYGVTQLRSANVPVAVLLVRTAWATLRVLKLRGLLQLVGWAVRTRRSGQWSDEDLRAFIGLTIPHDVDAEHLLGMMRSMLDTIDH